MFATRLQAIEAAWALCEAHYARLKATTPRGRAYGRKRDRITAAYHRLCARYLAAF